MAQTVYTIILEEDYGKLDTIMRNPNTKYHSTISPPKAKYEMLVKVNVTKDSGALVENVGGKYQLKLSWFKNVEMSIVCIKLDPVYYRLMVEVALSKKRLIKEIPEHDQRENDNISLVDVDDIKSNLAIYPKMEKTFIKYIMMRPFSKRSNTLMNLAYFGKGEMIIKILKYLDFDRDLVNETTYDKRTLLSECLEYGLKKVCREIIPFVDFEYVDLYDRPYITLMKIYGHSDMITRAMIDKTKMQKDMFGKTFYDY